MSGFVWLVGAGPGDPELLTVRARALLAAADVVAYDELCSDALLAAVGAQAELLPVGRRGHGASAAPYRLHPAVLERARAGKRVVRLKAGDPFIFGRGGEEAEELVEAGIAFAVVPGVSSALGAAAYAAIPLTHRQIASDVTFATGHDLLSDAGSASDWRALGQGRGTLVLFMAAKKLEANLQRLVAHGRPVSMGAAYVAAATTARQQVIVGTLADLAARVAAAPQLDPEAPALILVGDVVQLRQRLSWIECLPLHGRRILYLRARPGRSQLGEQLRARGAEVVEAPEIAVAPPLSLAPLTRALAELGRYDGVVFGCAAGVRAVVERVGAIDRDLRALPPVPLIAIGTAAVAALRAAGLRPFVAVDGACAAALAGHPQLGRGRLLLVAAEAGRAQLSAELHALGATVEHVAAYRLSVRWPRIRWDRFDLVVAPSSSAVQHLGASEAASALTGVPWVAIGPRTAEAIAQLGVARIALAAHDDLDALVAKVEEVAHG